MTRLTYWLFLNRRAVRGMAILDTMKTILLMGFEPFGGEPINPAWEVARALDGSWLDGACVHACQLPTRFDAAPEVMRAAIQSTHPVLAVVLGLASGRSEISIERVAINLIDARIPDNAGSQPHDQPVRAEAPAAYFSTLPVKQMLTGLRAAGYPAGLSLSAGAFVCNQVFFELQHQMAGTGARSGFIHLPALPEQAARKGGLPSMGLGMQTDAIRLALSLSWQSEPVALSEFEADDGAPIS
jgi:pyroglutamyl-peptidase